MKNKTNLPRFLTDNSVTVFHNLPNNSGYHSQNKTSNHINPQLAFQEIRQVGGLSGGLQNNGIKVCTAWVCTPLRVCVLTPNGQICWNQGETCTRTCRYT